MTSPEASPGVPDSTSHGPPQRRNVWEILGRAFILYKTNGLAFTGVLLWPVGQMVLGAYGSQVISLGLLEYFREWALQFPWAAIGAVVVISLLFVGLVIRGGWQFMIYWASLCLNAWEAETGQILDFKKAYQSFNEEKKTSYAILACTYFGLPALTFMPMILLSALGLFLGPHMLELLLIAGLLQSLFLGALWTISLIPLTFIFQIAAFEKGLPINPIHTFLLSCKLSLKQLGKTAFLQVAVFLLSNILIPQPLVWLLRLFKLSAPLDQLHIWMVQQTTISNEFTLDNLPLVGNILGQDFPWVRLLAQSMTDLCLSCVITLLLLPLGTIVFTLLYKDILKCDRSKKTWLGV